MKNENERVTLVLYPKTRTIGFVIYQGVKEILDFGIKKVDNKVKGAFEEKAKWFISYCKPQLAIIIDPTDINKKSKRVNKAIEDIKIMARRYQVPISEYTRSDIKTVFREFHVETKYDIAKRLIEWYPQLGSKEPYKRLAWMSEDYKMAVFDAFALMITHEYLKD